MCSLDELEKVDSRNLFYVAQGRCYSNHGNGFFISLKSVAMVTIATPLSNIK